ncbi:hypothetical protein FNV43_RR24163 [Rhamnella rubrinervis]|uniref:Uncharacterized protein n=1 Tax=Rhamnella rubrinervis TaxID=2594499 RepID=A0A8K0GPZ9_9ROSA|nr:hypothetical protein FNV43_RR24163 [Rhamnella rubrinervis]
MDSPIRRVLIRSHDPPSRQKVAVFPKFLCHSGASSNKFDYPKRRGVSFLFGFMCKKYKKWPCRFVGRDFSDWTMSPNKYRPLADKSLGADIRSSDHVNDAAVKVEPYFEGDLRQFCPLTGGPAGGTGPRLEFFLTNCSSTAGSDPGFHRWNEERIEKPLKARGLESTEARSEAEYNLRGEVYQTETRTGISRRKLTNLVEIVGEGSQCRVGFRTVLGWKITHRWKFWLMESAWGRTAEVAGVFEKGK